MSRGFQHDPIKEHAALTEVALDIGLWREAEAAAAHRIRALIAEGVRAGVIADHMGWSRATLYRWLAATPQPTRPKAKRSRSRAG